MLEIDKYRRVESLEEAWQLNQKKSSRILGGMLWLKMSRGRCGTAIDLSGLGLDRIEETEKEFRIGAMVTLRAAELHESLNAWTCGAVRDAVRSIVGVQFRNLATVGGSVWGRFGFSDVLTVLTALDASVELYRRGVLPIAEFAALPYDRDVLVRVIVPKRTAGFAALSMRLTRTDFPILTVAAGTDPLRVAVGARPQKAMLLTDPEGFLKDGITEESARAYAAWAAANVPTSSNLRGSADYRTHLTEVLVRRALLKAAAGNAGDAGEAGTSGNGGAASSGNAASDSAACPPAPGKTALQPTGGAEGKNITFELNGNMIRREVPADLLLIDLVRSEGALSVKRGCETSNCGLCTVFLDDRPVLSCSVLAARADGRRITTLEGLQEEAAEFAGFVADQGAEQCGFCNPGFVMNTLALFREDPDPSEEEIRAYLAGNLCRCSGYEGQLRGILNYLAWKKQRGGAADQNGKEGRAND